MTWLRQELTFWFWCRWRGHNSFVAFHQTLVADGRPGISYRICTGCHRVYPEDVDAACDALEVDLDALEGP